jgi:hypothetical protein
MYWGSSHLIIQFVHTVPILKVPCAISAAESHVHGWLMSTAISISIMASFRQTKTLVSSKTFLKVTWSSPK